MQRILELVAVFLLGGILALYIVDSKNNASGPVQHAAPKPQTQPSIDPPPQAAVNIANNLPATAMNTTVVKAKHYLAQGQIDLFLTLMAKHRSDADSQTFQELRLAFLQAVQKLKFRQQYRTAIEWLSDYLHSEYDDVEAMRALAEFHYLQKNYLAAIDTLYQAKSYAHDTDKISQITATLRSIVHEYATELKNHNDNLGLLDLYQRLVSVEPEYSANYLGLAQAYLALGNDADAERALNIIAYDPDTAGKVRQLLNVIENRSGKTQADAEPITLRRLGNNLLTPAVFNNNVIGRLLLDTGASLTVITPVLLQNLGLDYNHPRRKAWFNTANGVVEAPIFIIDRVSIGSQTVDHLEVAVMALDDQNINGLLGMNFLQHFQFSIDHKNNVLYLSPRT